MAATSRSGCFVWDVEKERIIMRFNEHGKNSVYTASWNQRDSKYIASSGADGNWYAFLFTFVLLITVGYLNEAFELFNQRAGKIENFL